MGENKVLPDLRIDEEAEMKKSALSVVFFKIVYSKEDVASQTDQFKPEMAHQVFLNESIFGYRSLSIGLYYLHNSARCYLDVQKTEAQVKDLEADNIMECLEPWLPDEYTTSQTELEKMVADENHKQMFGVVLSEFKDTKERLFLDKEIQVNYKVTKCDAKDESFQKFHSRFETLIVWYINDKIRARISQFFILPPLQRRGIGSQLYHTVINDIRTNPDVIDIPVEEPTPQFLVIRDYDDCTTVYKDLVNDGVQVSAGNKKKIFEYMKKHKFCKKQSQRILDILEGYKAMKSSTNDYRKFLASLKSRIAAEVERENRGSKRFCNLIRAGIVQDSTDRSVQVEAGYKDYVDEIEPSMKYLYKHFQQ
ncbi:hypothetical protein NQ315_003126 [Exocentrus adspersus]|uniref:histone acetyltransferase n=1 Tax=Exocentrus adspersus TaxID=1586481 RepID=A0AAV8W4R7_9CUCU|nr:hypothetical protein NQ315_003126 [Exocentrus adspersus]